MASCVRVRFIKTPGFIARSIAWWTNSLVDHAEFGTPEGTWIGAHVGAGVQERAAAYCLPSRELYYEIPCSEQLEAESLAWMRARIGTKYNTLDILGLAMHWRKLHRCHEVICSQFVTDGMLRWFGPFRYLNVQPEFTYLTTPDMDHLSPIFAGHLKRRIG